jgi:hypothetical protein
MRTSLFVSFLLGAAALPAQDREFGVSVSTTLTQVRAEAEAYKNVKVKFVAQFASLGKLSNPFFTRFTPTDYANFYAWADEQPIWQQGAYEDVFGMLFLSKQSAQLEELYQLRVYQRISITGIVRHTFQGTPWIEVMEFEPVDGQLDTAVLAHLYRGEKLMEQRLWQRAIAELTLVAGPSVPAHAVRASHRNLGICLLRIGEANLAVTYLQSARDPEGPPDLEVDRMLAAAGAAPDKEIDRTVDSRGLKDHERPMWEAFDGDAGARGARTLR